MPCKQADRVRVLNCEGDHSLRESSKVVTVELHLPFGIGQMVLHDGIEEVGLASEVQEDQAFVAAGSRCNAVDTPASETFGSELGKCRL